MAKILVIDDNATNRKALVTLLEHEGYQTVEARDGADGLAAIRSQRPQLVMSDILMPTMDGYEFVRQLRAEPEAGATPVIFHTAHYHEREAHNLAKICRVERVIPKPSNAAEILAAIEQVLAGAPSPSSCPITAEFDREHLRLVTNKLSNSVNELHASMEKRELTSEELRESEARFRQMAENIQDIFFLISPDYSHTYYISPAYERIWGRPVEGAYVDALAWTTAIHPDDVERMRLETRWDSGGSHNKSFEFRIVRPDGSIRWILTRTFLIPEETDREARVAGIATDITERKEAEERIQHLNRVYAVLSGINSLIVRVQDRDQLLKESCRLAVEHGHFKFVWCGRVDPGTDELRHAAWAGDSSELARLLSDNVGADTSAETLVATVMRSRNLRICDDTATDPLLAAYRPQITDRGYQSVMALPLVVSGKSVGCLVLATVERGFFDDEEIPLLVELAGDISFALDHIEKSERLNYLAYYDELTGIANRTFFHERLSLHVNAAARGGRRIALIVAQIERFESISDTLGRYAADQVIREFAERFTGCVGDPGTVARIGPDQFAAVILDIADEVDVAHTVVHAIERWWPQWLSAPFKIEGNELRLAANAGIALFPVDGADADTLLKHAEAALKKARATGDRYLFYTQHLSERGSEKLALESRLRRALENDEFLLHYQPKVDLKTRQTTGVEALLRWKNPDRGLVQPGEFISLMEETGIIVDVGAWVLRQACLDRSRWLELGFEAPRVAVNVSTVQLRRNDFVRMVKDTLSTVGNKGGIDIEVTESLIMQDAADNIAKLVDVRDLGIHIAIDDFGTGYSSLGYLAKLPVAVLKIDRSFIISMLDDPGAMTLVSTIISLAHALQLEVVAEGVESEEQAKTLYLVRCDQMQGYLISKPLPFDDMTAFLSRKHP